VTYSARSLLGQAWVLFVLAAISAALAGPAGAQAPDPAPTRVGSPRPDPAPTGRREAPPPRTRQAPAATPRTPVVEPPAQVTPPSAARQAPVYRSTPSTTVRRARVQPPKKPAAAKPQRAKAPLRKRAVKGAIRAIQPLATRAKSSPDGMLLAGGLALFVFLLGEAVFLALSVRFLRGTEQSVPRF
jgi:hypothetical protein